MTHQDIHELAPEYVLGTLDDVTRNRVVAHLSACPSCRAEVADVAKVLDGVGRSVDDVAPPPALRARIVAIAEAEPQVARAASPLVSPRRFDTAFRLAAAAVVAVALWQWSAARREVEQLRARVAVLQADANELLVARASIQDLEAQVRTVTHQAQVLRASDMLTYTLAAQAPARGAHARAYVSHKDGMVFTAEGLPQLPAGKVYQLWVIVNAKPISVGVFAPDATGRVHAVMDTPAINVMPATVAVTLEPTGGLPQPSGAVYLAGNALGSE